MPKKVIWFVLSNLKYWWWLLWKNVTAMLYFNILFEEILLTWKSKLHIRSAQTTTLNNINCFVKVAVWLAGCENMATTAIITAYPHISSLFYKKKLKTCIISFKI